jgi:8-oxo-dGTP pyrophosphatase MutT (NUDIX family)
MRRKVDSAGILLKNKNRFFLAHSTGSSKNQGWGIPKGRIDEGETLKDAAVRETREECGLKIDPSDIKLLTVIDYNSKDELGPVRKFLHVFLCEVPDEVLNFKFYCDSYFPHHKNPNVMIPEVDKFEWYDLEDAKKIATKSFKRVFELF